MTDPLEPREDTRPLCEQLFISMVYANYNQELEIHEVHSMGMGIVIALLPTRRSKKMSVDDELFLYDGKKIGGGAFAEDVQRWASTVDKWSVTELATKLLGLESEEFESIVAMIMESRILGSSWQLKNLIEVPLSQRNSTFVQPTTISC